MIEMLPQWEQPYLVDDASYTSRFGVRAIQLHEGIVSTFASKASARMA